MMSWLFVALEESMKGVLSYYLNYIVPVSVMSHCDLDIWRTNLKIHRVNARGNAYIQATFRRNSLKNNRENGIQMI